jgi:hypothetical protein
MPRKSSRSSAARKRDAVTPLSRRRFTALLAGALLASVAPARAVTIRKGPAAPKRAARSPAIEKGIAEQKAALAKQLQGLRDYPLPAGSDPGFVFRPLAPKRLR